MNDGARTILETADIGSIGCDLVEQLQRQSPNTKHSKTLAVQETDQTRDVYYQTIFLVQYLIYLQAVIQSSRYWQYVLFRH
jgi:hypothetical protein